jgi:drug/metabolite transporter (DMT)-like permease
MLYIGEAAAVITSITFAVNSALFTVAGRKVGSQTVNRMRLIVACLFLMIAHWITIGNPWPISAGSERWFWLGLSGFIGLVLGDAFLFQAFVWVGPQISMLMMSMAPILAAIVAWIFIGEELNSLQLLGIAITLLGVIWVVIAKNHFEESNKVHYTKGVLFGLAGATGQALGFVLAKVGIGGGFLPISANFIRVFTAMIVIWIITLMQKQAGFTMRQISDHPRALTWIIGGAFSGPFLGVSLSLFALQHASIGIVSTLMALPPIFLIPIEYYFFKEKFGWGVIVGTMVAMLGVAVLFLV